MSSIQSTSTGKQLLIQLVINLVSSAIVSYVMYRILENTDKSKSKSTATLKTTAPIAQESAPTVVAEEV